MANIGSIMFQLGDVSSSKKYFYASIKNITQNIKGSFDDGNVFSEEATQQMDSSKQTVISYELATNRFLLACRYF